LKHISSLRCWIFVSLFKCSISVTILEHFTSPLRYFIFVMQHRIFVPIFISGHSTSLVCIICLCRLSVSISVFELCTSHVRMIILHNNKWAFISATYIALSLRFPENKSGWFYREDPKIFELCSYSSVSHLWLCQISQSSSCHQPWGSQDQSITCPALLTLYIRSANFYFASRGLHWLWFLF